MAQRTIRDPKQLIRRFVTALAEAYPLDTVVLFGSYARGWQHAWSDVDLAVVSKAFDRCGAATWRKIRQVAHAISPQLDARPFGCKEFAQYERGDFVHEIRRTGKTIYQHGRLRLPRGWSCAPLKK